ncbi:hypothetical protein [Flexithrix dorotheae]|uniref:hypothetical protein n=1 Tax=Flexithrix dorotheae TaxID=70993 RepID=UPI00036ECDA2|nr:hypothetical protein [Flexithrix dorotheae]
MKKILLLLALFMPIFGFAQDNQDDEITKTQLLMDLNSKLFYFHKVNGGISCSKDGKMILNGVELDLLNSEIGYQSSEDGQDHYIYFMTTDKSESYTFTHEGEVLFKTNNILHPIKNQEQAVELVILFNFLKGFYTTQ